jgi:aspartate-semialdehyde dehydrogenase
MVDTIKPKTADGLQVALFGATSLLGQALRECLDERSFPVGSIRLYDQPEKEGHLTEFRKEAVLVTAPDPETLDRLDLAFLCGAPEECRAFLGWPQEKGFVAIDLSTASTRDPAVPVVHCGLNRSHFQLRRNIIASPGPIAQALASILAPLHSQLEISSAVASVFLPASTRGEEGLTELYRQTVDLLNFQEISRDIFQRQLAFNLVPVDLEGEGHPHGGASGTAIAAETLKVLEAGFPLDVGLLMVPVFHCHSFLVWIDCRAPLAPEEIGALLGEQKDLEVLRDGAGEMTPVELAGRKSIHVRPLGVPGRAETSHWLWVVADNLRSGAVLNAVRLAELLVREEKA